MSDYRLRKLARRVAKVLQDGRPAGCTCPPNPGSNRMPCDNKHISSPGCPYTKIEREAR